MPAPLMILEGNSTRICAELADGSIDRPILVTFSLVDISTSGKYGYVECNQ